MNTQLPIDPTNKKEHETKKDSSKLVTTEKSTTHHQGYFAHLTSLLWSRSKQPKNLTGRSALNKSPLSGFPFLVLCKIVKHLDLRAIVRLRMTCKHYLDIIQKGNFSSQEVVNYFTQHKNFKQLKITPLIKKDSFKKKRIMVPLGILKIKDHNHIQTAAMRAFAKKFQFLPTVIMDTYPSWSESTTINCGVLVLTHQRGGTYNSEKWKTSPINPTVIKIKDFNNEYDEVNINFESGTKTKLVAPENYFLVPGKESTNCKKIILKRKKPSLFRQLLTILRKLLTPAIIVFACLYHFRVMFVSIFLFSAGLHYIPKITLTIPFFLYFWAFLNHSESTSPTRNNSELPEANF